LRIAIAALLLVALSHPAGAAVEPADAEPEAAYTPSEELLELFEAQSDGGEAIVSTQQRGYFDRLPTRLKLLFDEAVELELMTEAEHFEALLALELRAPKLQLLMQDYCIVCHADPWQDQEALFSADPQANGSPSHMNLLEFTRDVHFRRGVSCAGCHGGDPEDTVMTDPTYESMPEAPERHEDRTWIPEFCARCHSSPTYMRGFNPGLPTDQYSKYEESTHGLLLLQEGDSKAAQCVSCHSAHGIRASKSPRSTVHPKNVPGTCSGCHADADYMHGYLGADGAPLPTDQFDDYRESVHGQALLERGDLGAPACNDCHGNHAAMPPKVSSITQVCRTCHAGNGELFDGSSHKEAFVRNGWSECGECHGTHTVATTSDSMLAEQSDSLCYECHREHASDNPECTRTAEYFHTSITALVQGTEHLDEQVEVLAERGLDVEPLTANIEGLRDILRQARSRIHAFDRGQIEGLENVGQEAIEAGWSLVAEGEAAYRFRRNGLFAAVGIMSLLALLLGLKIRQLESDD
jgi:predicted CXXCH cytochrome family protein